MVVYSTDRSKAQTKLERYSALVDKYNVSLKTRSIGTGIWVVAFDGTARKKKRDQSLIAQEKP